MKAQRLPLVLGEDAVENQRVEVDIQIEPAAKTLKRYGEDWGGSEQRNATDGVSSAAGERARLYRRQRCQR